ncbi:alkaline phosphatase family protein [soil metagenome]
MQRLISLIIWLLFLFASNAQDTGKTFTSILSEQRPQLVVGIVIDQMRWDYLYRYYDRYATDGGFKRLLNQGFACENTMIPYVPTITACGHTSIFTGSVPAINGITGNDWWDYKQNSFVYCTDDTSVHTIGSNTDAGKMSPVNLLVTTIGDELKLATNFQSKVIGIALKDRAAILPAGHSANAAYWYDSKTGDWISSSYYMTALPAWVNEFNKSKLPDQYYAKDWNTLYPIASYQQSDPDNNRFPHSLKQHATKNYGVIVATPYGIDFSIEMAKAAIIGEALGAGTTTDFLSLSLSSPDYIGHAFGPNSIEVEDCFLRLDKQLGLLLDFLDAKTGKGKYLVFLTADHGAANVPSFLNEHKIPAGNFDNETVAVELNKYLDATFKTTNLVIGILNYQVYLDRDAMVAKHLNKNLVYKTAIEYLLKNAAIDRVIELDAVSETTLNTNVKKLITTGYFPSRSGDLQILFRPQWIDGFLNGGTTHGVWNPYDAHIPLIWYGGNIKPGKTYKDIYMTDIAPTVAALLKIQMPNGCVGHVIDELIK